MRKTSPALTSKVLRWIDEYLIDLNGAAAAVRAGYSVKSARSIAHENLTKPHILAAIQARQAVMANELQITRQGVIQGLLAAVDMGKEQRNPAAMIGALREVAKLLGFYQPAVKQVVITSDRDAVYSKLNAMTDQELIALIDGAKT